MAKTILVITGNLAHTMQDYGPRIKSWNKCRLTGVLHNGNRLRIITNNSAKFGGYKGFGFDYWETSHCVLRTTTVSELDAHKRGTP